jgi:RNA polymerase sigma-70 factor (ECF subfamily)
LSTDDQIVQQVRDGNLQAFELLVARHGPTVYAYTRSRVGSEADASELTQDTFVEVYLAFDRYQLGMDFGVWVRSIARNLIRNHFRTLSRRHEMELLEAFLEIENPGPAPELPVETLRRCIEKLDDLARNLIKGFYGRSHSVATLAREMGRSVSSVKVVLHRARYRLRDCLRAQGEQAS